MEYSKIQSAKKIKASEKYSVVFLVRMRSALCSFWRGVREWCGDASYEKYLSASATKTTACARLTPAEFYVEQLNRRYSRPSRCC